MPFLMDKEGAIDFLKNNKKGKLILTKTFDPLGRIINIYIFNDKK